MYRIVGNCSLSAAVVSLIALLFSSSCLRSAQAAINLELRPASQTVEVGQPVELGLYAVASPDQSLSTVDVVLLWSEASLNLTGNSNTGAVPMLYSGFPAIDGYGLNLNLADGDAFYTAFAMLGVPVNAAPAGTLLTTYQFVADAPGTATIDMPRDHKTGARTRVLDGTVPNLDVTGVITGAVIDIVADTCPADLDDNDVVDVFDLFILLGEWGDCIKGCTADLTDDDFVNVFDLFILLSAWGPCP